MSPPRRRAAQLLRAAVAATAGGARRGGPALLLVAGSPNTGKSHIINALKLAAREQGAPRAPGFPAALRPRRSAGPPLPAPPRQAKDPPCATPPRPAPRRAAGRASVSQARRRRRHAGPHAPRPGLPGEQAAGGGAGRRGRRPRAGQQLAPSRGTRGGLARSRDPTPHARAPPSPCPRCAPARRCMSWTRPASWRSASRGMRTRAAWRFAVRAAAPHAARCAYALSARRWALWELLVEPPGMTPCRPRFRPDCTLCLHYQG
jgi:hypothetical protein